MNDRYLVIETDYMAREHPDAEYKYRGVFVAAIINEATRRDLNPIYTLKNFIVLHTYNSVLTFVSVDVFSELHKLGPSIFACS